MMDVVIVGRQLRMPDMNRPCRTCGGIVTMNQEQGSLTRRYSCFSTEKAVCKICFRHLAVYESVECDRCADEGGMIGLGNG